MDARLTRASARREHSTGVETAADGGVDATMAGSSADVTMASNAASSSTAHSATSSAAPALASASADDFPPLGTVDGDWRRRQAVRRKDRQAMIHVYGEVPPDSALMLQLLPDGPECELFRAAESGAGFYHWRTVEQIAFGAGGFEYCIVAPSSSRGLLGAVTGLFASRTRSKPRRIFPGGWGSSIVHRFDPGLADNTRSRPERLQVMLESLLTNVSSGGSDAVAGLLTLNTSGDIDYTGAVLNALRLSSSEETLKLCVQVIASHKVQMAPSTLSVLTDALNSVDLSASGLVPVSKRDLEGVLRRVPADDTTWIAALRWGVDVPRRKLRPASGIATTAFTSSVRAYERLHLSRVQEDARSIVRVAGKMLEQVPNLEALAMLLTVKWRHSSVAISNDATIAGVVDSAFLPHSLARELDGFVRVASARLVQSLPLSSLLRLYRDWGEMGITADVIRCEACLVSTWDMATPALLAAFSELGVGESEALSERVIADVLQNGDPVSERSPFHLIADLLAVLKTTPARRAHATVKWVRAFVTAFERKGEGVCQLYLSIHRAAHAWSAEPLADAKAALSTELLGLHRQKGCGGSAALLEAARRLGDNREFMSSLVRKELFDPAIREHLRLLCDGSPLQLGERASRVLTALAPLNAIPHKLAEDVLLAMLQLLEQTMPTDLTSRKPILALSNELLVADRAQLWARMLVLKGEAKRLRKHRLVERVRSSLQSVCNRIRSRSIQVDVAESLLPMTARDGHRTLTHYSTIVEAPLTADACNAVIADISVVRAIHNALQYFCQHRLDGVNNIKVFTEELQRASNLTDVPLNTAESEAHWGAQLTVEVREMAQIAYRLRGSKLFCQEWEGALSATEEEGSGLTVAILVRVGRRAHQSFGEKCEQMLRNEELTLREAGVIFERPQSREAARLLLEELPRELELMFGTIEATPAVIRLHERLEWFAKMVLTLQDASALRGLVGNLAVAEKPPSPLGELSAEVIRLGTNDDDETLTALASMSNQFYRLLEPFTEQLAAADHLSQTRTIELLRFLRDEVGDNDLRDLAEAVNEDQAGLGEAVSAVLKVQTVLKPLLRTAPVALHGSPAGALEVLGVQLGQNQMRGGELSSLLEQCTSHMHALRRTYKSITEKGESSKEQIKDVVEHGVLVFGFGPPRIEFDGVAGASPLDQPTARSSS